MEPDKPKHLIRQWTDNVGWNDVYQGNNFLTALFYFMKTKKDGNIGQLVTWSWQGNYED